MAEDREVLRTVWEGKLPISFELAPDEVHTLNVPEPFYLMVPRLLYFPLVTDKIRKHFAQYVNPESVNKDMWFDYNSQPIKWNYPIGLCFDLHSSPDLVLPWRITVHFDGYPDTQILRCSSKDTIRIHFMSTVKEADALKHKGHVVNAMQEKDHHQLWAGFNSDRFDQFWSVNKKLMESVAGEGFKYIPVRCYLPERAPAQRLVRPIDDTTGTWTTLADMLLDWFPGASVKALIHGIEPPPETPLQWLSEHLSFPDNFLHLVIKTKS